VPEGAGGIPSVAAAQVTMAGAHGRGGRRRRVLMLAIPLSTPPTKGVTP
jgi:hypothetical protein